MKHANVPGLKGGYVGHHVAHARRRLDGTFLGFVPRAHRNAPLVLRPRSFLQTGSRVRHASTDLVDGDEVRVREPCAVLGGIKTPRWRVHASAQHAEVRGAAAKLTLERFLGNHVLGA